MSQPTGRSVCLGFFVLGQLLFLVTSNGVGILHDLHANLTKALGPEVDNLMPGWTGQEGHAWQTSRAATTLTNRWSELTGQSQSWSLFAPGVSAECVFPAVRTMYAEAPDSASAIGKWLLPLAATDPVHALVLNELAHGGENRLMPPAAKDWLSDNEPSDIDAFFRFGDFRLRRFEGTLTLSLTESPDEAPESRAKRWRGEIEKFVASHSAKIQAYLRWRLDRIRGAGPEPQQVILVMRRYHINEPDSPEVWQGPFVVPVARWQPRAVWLAEFGSVEMFNPVTKRFEGVLK